MKRLDNELLGNKSKLKVINNIVYSKWLQCDKLKDIIVPAKMMVLYFLVKFYTNY